MSDKADKTEKPGDAAAPREKSAAPGRAGKTDPALAKLRVAAKGLLFMSESDKRVKAFLWDDVKTDGPMSAVDAAALAAAKKVPDGSQVKTRTLDEFFAPATTNQEWFGEEEKAQAERFRALVTTLKETLTGPVVFRVEREGESEVAAYVVGRTAAGNLAGVQTELIET